jgi:uncharacterized membrane protein
MTHFLREPASVRNAANVIVAATAVVVVAGGVAMRVLDHDEYPTHLSGRIVAVFVMLQGIAFVSILVAAITSTFVARAAAEREQAEAGEEESVEERIDARFDDLAARLERVEAMLTRLSSP